MVARRILQLEAAALNGGAAGEAAASTGKKLRVRLGRVFSELGMDALLRRAVLLARGDYPFLPVFEGPESLDHFGAVLDGVGAAEAASAAEAVVGHAITLLARFIGDDLTMRAIGEVWPGAIPAETSGATHKEQV